jgi:hypothetical protein
MASRFYDGGMTMDFGFADPGRTRFRLFPQAPFLHPDRPPEIVALSSPPGTIGPGPSDDRLFVMTPIGKPHPYGIAQGPFGTPYLSLPPWRGPIVPPAHPDAEGHFDHIPVGTPQFRQAHLYGTIRFVMEVWERYLGGRIQWHFARDFGRLEVLIYPPLDNARVGYGYMEAGSHQNDDGSIADYALNFDVIAHEFGHLIIYALIGVPLGAAQQEDYSGFQESAADSAALIAALHFESNIDQLLADTHGNLYAANELNRFAELSTTDQIRIASNSKKMSDFALGWSDEHDLSEPLTGAIFDILVDIYQETLVEQGTIGRALADLSDEIMEHPESEPVIQAAFSDIYRRTGPAPFREALISARDYLGRARAETWRRLSAQYLSFDDVGRMLLAVDDALSGGRFRQEIYESFDWREIGTVRAGPRLPEADEASHSLSSRTLMPETGNAFPKMSFRERYLIATGAG